MKQVLLVTASSRGIGAAICRRAARDGYDIAVNHRKSHEDAEKLVAELNGLGVRAMSFQADVSREAEVMDLFRSIDAELGPVTALVNNAGGAAVGAADGKSLLADVSGEAILDVMALNLISSIYCSREAIRRMSTERGGQGGVIVNITSDCGRRGGAAMRRDGAPGLVLYAAAKAGADGLTLSLATEVASQGIRVNAIRPATVLTEAKLRNSQDFLDRMTATLPMRRAGTPSEIADVASFLLSDNASFMTGALVDVTGGR